MDPSDIFVKRDISLYLEEGKAWYICATDTREGRVADASFAPMIVICTRRIYSLSAAEHCESTSSLDMYRELCIPGRRLVRATNSRGHTYGV